MSVNVTADGNSAEFNWSGSIRKAIGHFRAEGSFGGGTLKLQFKAVDSDTFVDVGDDVSFTADGNGSFRLPSGTLRVNMASSTTPDVNFDINES